MATIVLVHGIAQEQMSAECLEATWLPALAGGLSNSGNSALAQRIWKKSPGDLDVKMAFYGTSFLDPDGQGLEDGLDDLNEEELNLAERLAAAWLTNAADYAPDYRDRGDAARDLLVMNTVGDQTAQGLQAGFRPALNALAGIRWFAPIGIGVAGTFVKRALRQVTRYLNNEGIRSRAQQQVHSLIEVNTRLIIGHSLGSVVAYEALNDVNQPTALLTLGSPLGLRSVVYDRLRPQPARVPECLTRWDNLVDRDDLVAAHLDLAPYFPPYPGKAVRPITLDSLDNGSVPHDVVHYLNKPSTGRLVAEALGGWVEP